jgi:hypothetical protein
MTLGHDQLTVGEEPMLESPGHSQKGSIPLKLRLSEGK